VEGVSNLGSVWREGKDGTFRHLGGEPMVLVPWLGDTVELSGGGFVQVNQEAGEALHGWIRERIGTVAGRTVVDAYCGVGSLGRALARDGGKVVGIESDPGAVSAARRGAPPGFRVVQGRVEEELEELMPADILLLNPPRAGVDASVPDQVRSNAPRRVVYVSCDPATLARDLKRLGGMFSLEEIRAFDLFPQTAHVEAVALLKRKDD
jgi:23S rRNA (uracil1939-C5)-methyltransferase